MLQTIKSDLAWRWRVWPVLTIIEGICLVVGLGLGFGAMFL